MNTTVVYLDKIFFGNLLVNWAILWSAGRLSHVRASHFRILAGAFLGGVYSVALFLPGVDYLFSFYAKFTVSLLMVAAAFAPLPPRRFILCLAFFYLVSFTLGGLVMGVTYFFSSTAVPGQVSSYFEAVSRHLWPGLAAALLLLLTSVAVLPGYFKNRRGIEAVKLPVTVYMDGRKVTLRGLVDTGNSLCDPVSGEPVVVVEHSAIKDVLPGPMKETGAFSRDAVSVIESMMNTPWSGRLRLIPFQSLGNDHGILLGIKPDSVEFVRDGRLQKVEKVVIGVHGRRLDAGGDYNALINPSLLERAVPA